MRALPLTSFLAAALLVATPARAQQPPGRNAALGTLVDGVWATVNDSAILVSTVRTAFVPRLEAMARQFGNVTPAQENGLLVDALRAEIKRHQMAHVVKSLGVLPPEHVNHIVDAEIARRREKAVREVGGSLTEFSQELKRQNRTWPSLESEERTKHLGDLFHEIAVSRRLSRKTSLYVTPSMLRREYAENLSRFVHEPAAQIAQVRFRGPDAKANAERASAAWRQEEITQRQLADRFPGAVGVADMEASSLTARQPVIAAFGHAGPRGAVSDPIADGDSFLVAKVMAHRPGRNGRFEDPDVQNELRDLCLTGISKEFERQGMIQAQERTVVWTPGSR